MRTDDAISFYGGQSALARALGIAQPSVADWKKFPPPARQIQLERITGGALKAEPDCLDRLLNPPKPKAKKTKRRKARA